MLVVQKQMTIDLFWAMLACGTYEAPDNRSFDNFKISGLHMAQVNLKDFLLTIEVPWDEATRTMCHIESPGRVRKPVGSEYADHGWNSSFECELHLCFM